MSKIQYLFPFLKYIKPIWYYNLVSAARAPYWSDYDKLTEQEQALIDFDHSFSSLPVSRLDAAYQAWHKGIVTDDVSHCLNIEGVDVSVKDQYRFVRKYFNPFFCIYIFIFRLLSLYNPIKETAGFFSSFKIKRINPDHKQVINAAINDFDSSLIARKPFVSVIIPTLNRYKYLADVLSDLEMQTYSHFEVIICDQTAPFDDTIFSNRNLDIRLIRQSEKALWLARNTCIQQSKGELILLFDDDSRVDPDWIEMHIRCLDFYKADICSGVSLSTVGAKIPGNYSCYRWGDQLDTGNAMLYKSVFAKVGLFDRQFERQRMGDGEFGLRCYLAGLKNISSPDAKRIHLKVSEGGLRQMGSWDAFRPKKLFSPRPIPSVLYLSRKYFGTKNTLLWLLLSVPPSIIPYKFKGNAVLNYLSLLLIVFTLPFVAVQVIISWRAASRMLREGDKIATLA